MGSTYAFIIWRLGKNTTFCYLHRFLGLSLLHYDPSIFMIMNLLLTLLTYGGIEKDGFYQ